MPIEQSSKTVFSEFPPGHEEMQDAVNRDGYEYLQTSAPHYLSAVEAAVVKGATVDEITAFISRLIGPDRQGLVKRCAQAAAYLKKRHEQNYGANPFEPKVVKLTPSGVTMGNLGA